MIDWPICRLAPTLPDAIKLDSFVASASAVRIEH